MRKLVALLRRDTGKAPYIAEIDSLRFVAISSTVLYHLLQKTHLWLLKDPSLIASRLNRGVELFFAISGFVLALPFARYWLKEGKKVELKTYFLRRLTRIEPPYLASVLLCFVLVVVVKKDPLLSLLPHFAATLFYLHSLIFGALSSINPVTWSLEIEIQFYILVPLLTLVFAIRSKSVRRALLVVVILALSVMALALSSYYRSNHSLLGNLQFFLGGFLFADIYLLDPPTTRRYLWDLAAIAAWCLFLGTNQRWWSLMMPLGLVAVCWSVFAGRIANRLFRLSSPPSSEACATRSI